MDPDSFELYERLKGFYAEQLYIWGLTQQRLAVLKSSNLSDYGLQDHNNLKMTVDCQTEGLHAVIDATEEDNFAICTTKGNTSMQCKGCLKASLYCALCLLPIKGLSSTCVDCGHVGHLRHLRKWFATNEICPAPDCDCNCSNLAGK